MKKVSRRFIDWFIDWMAALALWTLLTFSASTAELCAGAACATLTVIALEVTFKAEPLCFRPTLPMLLQIKDLPLLIAKGLGSLAVVFLHRLRGGHSLSGFRAAKFSASGSTAEAAARRVLVVSFLSTPPNSLVVGADREANELLLHQVRVTPLPKLIRKLETCR